MLIVADPKRVGELDEEMVFETRAGEVFLLGASSWRVSEITHDRVIVTPAAGEPGKMPFWHGDRPGRPRAFGEAVGGLTRKIARAADDEARAFLEDDLRLDASAAKNLVAYVREQREATGEVPSDRAIVVERFRDELGDWRVCPRNRRPCRGRMVGLAIRHRALRSPGWPSVAADPASRLK